MDGRTDGQTDVQEA